MVGMLISTTGEDRSGRYGVLLSLSRLLLEYDGGGTGTVGFEIPIGNVLITVGVRPVLDDLSERNALGTRLGAASFKYRVNVSSGGSDAILLVSERQ